MVLRRVLRPDIDAIRRFGTYSSIESIKAGLGEYFVKDSDQSKLGRLMVSLLTPHRLGDARKAAVASWTCCQRIEQWQNEGFGVEYQC